MGQALYRKYRSRTLDEIVGQSHITAMLKRAIEKDRVAHAYLLTGPRGVGKTSIARILAHEINQLPYSDETTHLDIIEIDAASNNSVEDIRDLREKVMVAPTSAHKKVYIIDEVHMLSKSAFNALLKTLEEPPEHVVFILATTNVEKLPATIISRVQRFNFRLITPSDAVPHLRSISEAENIIIDDDALELIARYGQGSFRDSISLLDQLRNLTDGAITPTLIEQVVGLADDATITTLLAAYDARDLTALSSCVTSIEEQGVSALTITDQLVRAVRDSLVEHPERLPLLDALLDVTKSNWPYVKLLTALTANTPVATVTALPVTAATPKKSKPKAASEAVPPKTSEPAPQSQPVAEPPQTATPPTPITADQPFPWTDLLGHIKKESTGAFTILGACTYSFDGTTLTIYAGKSFAKKQLDKSLPLIQKALEAIGVLDGIVTIVPRTKPPKSSDTAAVLDIMGGGEEVTL